MSLPILDNHDSRIRYFELLLEGDISALREIPLPPGYRYRMYQPGDREAWIEIERSARELDSFAQGLSVWEKYFGAHEECLPARMCFIENSQGQKVATATAYFDIQNRDPSGDGWLHWVAVRREEQGKGLSKPLISHALGIMRELGHIRAKIPTQTTTWLACKIYLDLGFRPVSQNLASSRDGWRIIKRLTDHPALKDLDAAEDGEVLAPQKKRMTIDILTIFPEMFDSVLNASILGRARAQGLITIEATDIRPFSASKHKNTDDYPFGGGAGMLMMAQPIADAIKAVCAKRGVICRRNDAEDAGETSGCPASSDASESPADSAMAETQAASIASETSVKRIYLSPRGIPLTQKIARSLATEEHLILLCGHYEGVDQRVLDRYIDMEISIGDYILTGGELGAMVLADCVARLIPGVLGSEESPVDESFSESGLLEYPQYTRPRQFEGMDVPEVLLNGDHAKIATWRKQEAYRVTAQRRPDLLQQNGLPEKKED